MVCSQQPRNVNKWDREPTMSPSNTPAANQYTQHITCARHAHATNHTATLNNSTVWLHTEVLPHDSLSQPSTPLGTHHYQTRLKSHLLPSSHQGRGGMHSPKRMSQVLLAYNMLQNVVVAWQLPLDTKSSEQGLQAARRWSATSSP